MRENEREHVRGKRERERDSEKERGRDRERMNEWREVNGIERVIMIEPRHNMIKGRRITMEREYEVIN